MSAACIAMAQVTAAAATCHYYRRYHGMDPLLPHPDFADCEYCKCLPIRGQEDPHCRSCGAPLKHKNDSKPTTEV